MPYPRDIIRSFASPVRAGLLFFAFAVAVGVIGFSSGLLVWAPTSEDILRTMVVALVVPAFAEELVFRGPHLLEAVPIPLALGWSGIAYPAWHVLETLTFLPAASSVFLDVRFLLITCLFGIAASLSVLMSRRLWPAIAAHWTMVVVWKHALGGPTLL